MKTGFLCATVLLALTGLVSVQPAKAQSPPAEASTTINGKKVTVKYSAPSVRGRKIFGEGGQLSKDGTYPVWRAGANDATALSTETALDIGGVNVPAGNYTLYVDVKDPNQWTLIISKQTGQWGTEYNQAQDLGRVKMTMGKPAAMVETLKYTLTPSKLTLEWENHSASVPLKAK